MRLSITCIGHNEVNHLRELLPELLKWGDEVIYVDCESEDGSFEFAQSVGCRVFRRPNNMNLNVNKSYAMAQAQGEWIFYVDPDERFERALQDEVTEKIASSSAAAFKLPRRNHFFGRWLKHGGQYPDTQLRLFRKGKGRFPNQHVHESLQIDGAVELLNNPMLHFPYLTISQFLRKMDFYSTFEAQHLYMKGVRPCWSNACRYLFWKPKSRFVRRYFFKGGFRDGIPGFFAAAFDGIGWMLRYFKLWEMYQGSDQTYKMNATRSETEPRDS
jgi:glycosyltransferase involved in cell wall biosynthesis